MKFRLSVLFILASILWVHSPLLKPGLPITHDSQMHIARFANYYLALKQGQYPPRLAPNLNNGFGYPVFNFNYPLANMLATPLIAANLPIEDTLKIITLLALMASGTGMYLLTSDRFGKKAGLLASLVYVFNPYQFTLIYVRGTIGETISFGILPWLLYAMKRVVREKNLPWMVGLIGIAVAFLLAHNIIVLFSVPLVLGYGLWLTYGSSRKFWRLIIPGLWAAGMSLFFWVPALAEKKWVTLDKVPLSRLYYQHFPTLNQLLAAPFAKGYSRPGPVDGISFHLGSIQILAVVLSLYLLFRKNGRPRGVWPVLVGLAVGLYLMLPISRPVWELVPALWYVQFPWRLLFFFQIGAALLTGFVVYAFRLRTAWVALISLLIIILGRSYTNFEDRFSFPNEYWLTTGQTSSLSDENMPINFNKGHAYSLLTTAFADLPVYASPAATINVETWTGSYRRYRVEAAAATIVAERTAYFPGWETKVDGVVKEISSDNPGFPGLISFEVPTGLHTIETRFTEKTPARTIGDWLTLVSLVGAGGWLAWSFCYNARGKVKETS